ncbi:arginyl-tRNA--protein transferase 1 [Striga asiatica]|uniref:Arginyl-tRNA--protein transferase n=1 Tax=Striga asiatica TaxID=4170 RepID=A0A5A7RDJ1_STRAF|nr:arginyl-tRNA--protein transferase 1 [Striga asiatica]
MADAKKMRNEASTSGTADGGGGDEGRLESEVVDVGRRKSTCGYCKSGGRTSISHGLWAHSLRVDDYQALLDRGWRRSGCFLYKPDMEKTCCPSYTIRLKASDFVPSKEQIRVSKRMKRFLNGQLDAKETDKIMDEPHTSREHTSIEKTDEIMHFLSHNLDATVQQYIKGGKFSSDIQLPKASIKRVSPAKRKLGAEKSEELLFSCNIAFQIAAALKRLKRDADHMNESSQHVLEGTEDLSPKAIAEILTKHSKQLIESHGLLVRACIGHINFYSALKQTAVVESGIEIKSIISSTRTGGNDESFKKCSERLQSLCRRFEVRLKRSSFDDEEYSLYRKYQIKVHNDAPDHVTESSYKRFLVDTPLIHVPANGDQTTPPCGFGSFHQQYVVDGNLIAVGVIDILPKCLSSKYLFWDPDFAFLSLGKFSALEEIRWVSENQLHCPSLEFYYLGYYIHSCSKMRYKAAYRPSELLCPLRFQWVPYNIAKPLLDRRKYVVFSDYATERNGECLPPDIGVSEMDEQHSNCAEEIPNDVTVNDKEMELDSDCSVDESESESESEANVSLEDGSVDNILIGVRGARLRYKDIRHAFDPNQRNLIENQLQRYVRVVGAELSEQMVYSLG